VRVRRLREYLASFSLTPVGVVALAVLVGALGLFALGPSGVQAPALIVAVLLLVGMVGGAPVGRNRWGAWRNPSLAERRQAGNRGHQARAGAAAVAGGIGRRPAA
jgi:hypothetical protein